MTVSGANRVHESKAVAPLPEVFLDGRVTLHRGDCLEIMRKLPEDSIDAVVCDPPYHLQSIIKRFAKTGRTDKTRTRSGPHQRTANGFMNKHWDGGDIAFRPETWQAAYRVLKPGAYLLAFSSTRTFGRMSVAIEDAGFICHPFIAWIFGQGFPKAHRIAASGLSDLDRVTEGWDGWRYGTQSLKPSIEPIFVGQKPFSEENGWLNVQRWGTGALNIDRCRVATDENLNGGAYAEVGGRSVSQSLHDQTGMNVARKTVGKEFNQPPGRWPANVIHDGSDEVAGMFPDAPGQQRAVGPANGPKPGINVYGKFGPRDQCEPRNDSGSAARFFYTAKADADDRLGSKHPTVKPLDLMQYLVRLVTPPGGLVLDPFAGTGTTGEAAWREGMRAVLIEREPEYLGDIRRRMVLALGGPEERQRESIKASGKTADAGPLFAGSPPMIFDHTLQERDGQAERDRG
jgi:site-specific DNA-methyltransferase (adenine-specific)